MKKIKIILHFILLLILLSRCTEEPIKSEDAAKKSIKITLTADSDTMPNGRTKTGITEPSSGATFYSGTTMRIGWGIIVCIGCGGWASEYVNIDLYMGSNYVSRIASNVRWDAFKYDWLITNATYLSSDYNVRLTSTSSSSNYSESNYFTLMNPDDCYFSSWSLSGLPSGSILNNTTVQYKIQENGTAPKARANSPIMKVYSYYPINVIYNGTTYYCTGSGVNIPISGSGNCPSNPIIDAPLKFVKIGTISNTVMVKIEYLSYKHTFLNGYNGYHSFGVN